MAKDYFRLGVNFPLMNSFSEWIEKGYDTLVLKRKNDQIFSSWRFWAQDFGRETLICGLIRESSDSIGRPYPLLIIGNGTLNEWHTFWDLLPFACEKTWEQLEYMSAQKFANAKDLEEGLQRIRPPSDEWPAFFDRRENFIKSNSNSGNKFLSLHMQELESEASLLSEKTEGFICLEKKLFSNQVVLIIIWHSLIKKYGKEMPSSIFIGGTLEETFLALFKRPLITSDFVRLWSVYPFNETRK